MNGEFPAADRRRQLIIAIAVLAVILLGLTAWLVFHGSGKSSNNVAASSTSSSSTSTSTSTTATSVTSKTSAPTSTTAHAGTTVPAPTVVSDSGAYLHTVPPPVTQSSAPPSADCHLLGDGGWTVTQCNKFTQTGPSGTTTVATLIERMGSGPDYAWRAFVLHFSQGKGTWLVDLTYADDAGHQVSEVKYVAKDMTGDGVDEVVFGFRLQGSGSILSYDIVQGMFSTVHVAAHRELSHGQVSVATGGVTDWAAEYQNGAPNCCPTYFQQDAVTWSGSAWVLTTGPHVATAGSGDF